MSKARKRKKKKPVITIAADLATELGPIKIFDVGDSYIIQSFYAGRRDYSASEILNPATENHTVKTIFLDKKTGAPIIHARITVKEAKKLIEVLKKRLKDLTSLKKQNKNIKGLVIHPSRDVCYIVGD